MPKSHLLTLPLLLALTISSVSAGSMRNTVPSINATVEHGVNTECKTCPYSLCPNTAAYKGDREICVSCWARGDNIYRGGSPEQGSDVWLKTEDECYVTEYDLTSYDGDYTSDLEECRGPSTRKRYTEAPVLVEYDVDCRVCPSINCDILGYHKAGKECTAVCYTENGDSIVDDKTWYKTTQNCYVSETGLNDQVSETNLDQCGPIPFLKYAH